MKEPSHYRAHVALLIIAIASVTASCSFAVVWVQQQISRSAANCLRMERELVEINRRLSIRDSQYADIVHPLKLQSLVMGQLRKATDRQVVVVDAPYDGDERAYAAAEPVRHPLDLALIDVGLRP